MKNILILFFVICAGLISKADSKGVLRQAKVAVEIRKSTFTPENGLPNYVTTSVCTKQGVMNVYADASSFQSSDLAVVKCDAKLYDAPVSVVVGGELFLSTETEAGKTLLLKTAFLVLGWGEQFQEVPQIAQTAQSDSWLHFRSLLSPLAAGKVIGGVLQSPEPKEYFSALVTVDDETPAEKARSTF